MIETLTDIKEIFRQIFSDNKPRLDCPPPICPPITKPAPATNSIVHKVLHVRPYHGHRPSSSRQGWAGKYCPKNSLKFFSPIKQIPVESFSLAVAKPARSAISLGPEAFVNGRAETWFSGSCSCDSWLRK